MHNDTLNAPIYVGMIVGGVDILYDGNIIGRGVLIAEEDIPASEMLLKIENLKDLFLGRAFLLSVLFSVIGVFLYYRISFIKYRKGNRNCKKKNVKRFY